MVNAPILKAHILVHVRPVIPVMVSLVKTSMNVLMPIPVLMYQTVLVSTTTDLSHALVTADGPRKTASAKMLMNVPSQHVKTILLASIFQVLTLASVTLVSSMSATIPTTPVSARTSMNANLVSLNAVPIHSASTTSDHMTVHVIPALKTTKVVTNALIFLSALLSSHHVM